MALLIITEYFLGVRRSSSGKLKPKSNVMELRALPAQDLREGGILLHYWYIKSPLPFIIYLIEKGQK